MPFQIIRDDLTRMQVDVIVNTANPNPVIGRGTDSAIYKAAGEKKLLKEREKIGRIERGQAAITGAYSLPSRYIIHTVGPVWEGGTAGEADLLRSCYENSLKLAVKRKCRSIAFPLISTGVYGFPKDLALEIVTDTIRKFLDACPDELMVYLVIFGPDTTRLSESMFDHIEKRIDDLYAKEKAAEEYCLPMEDAECSYAHVEREEILPDYHSRPMLSAKPSFLGEISSVPKAKAAKPGKKRSLQEILAHQEETFSEMLLRLIQEKGMTNAEAYKRANVDKKLFSKIKNKSDYQPKKQTAMAFAIGLRLNPDEARDLLARAGYAFSPSVPQDMVVKYCIEEEEYDIFHVECILFDLGLDTLSSMGMS